MSTDDQSAVVEFLSARSTHGGAPVERIETHSAIVFLAGARALKLKRAVRFDYLDFSTPERRKAMCEAEVRLNQRTAPAIYRRVVAVTRQADGSLALDAPGMPVDWLVEMERFDQEAVFDRLGANGRLSVDLMTPLAISIAGFHSVAEVRRDYGGMAEMKQLIAGNAAGFEQYAATVLDRSACARLTDEAYAETDRRGALLDARRAQGYVRQCHGDLHLRNIVLLDGQPTLFDAIEFNDGIACIDVLYDLAFLLMDLWRRELRPHANTVWNEYLNATNDLDGLPLMPLFLSCRAAVRAKTTATTMRVQSDSRRVDELRQMAVAYLDLAERLLRPPRPVLVAIGGLSGSGKSRLALSLAPSIGSVPGALVLRSDEIRKRLQGVPRLQRLGSDGYTPEVSSRVYSSLAERAWRALQGGYSVVVDAVYARSAERSAIREVAEHAAVPFTGIWLEAPDATLLDRVKSRRMDPSDADEDVVRMQRRQDRGRIDWHVVDASVSADAVLRSVQGLLPLAEMRPMHR
jgi:uncharacterized protein